MSSITVNIPEEHLPRLLEIAANLGVTIEELARMSLEELIALPEGFERAADYVLKKNAELYRRLA